MTEYIVTHRKVEGMVKGDGRGVLLDWEVLPSNTYLVAEGFDLQLNPMEVREPTVVVEKQLVSWVMPINHLRPLHLSDERIINDVIVPFSAGDTQNPWLPPHAKPIAKPAEVDLTNLKLAAGVTYNDVAEWSMEDIKKAELTVLEGEIGSEPLQRYSETHTVKTSRLDYTTITDGVATIGVNNSDCTLVVWALITYIPSKNEVGYEQWMSQEDITRPRFGRRNDYVAIGERYADTKMRFVWNRYPVFALGR